MESFAQLNSIVHGVNYMLKVGDKVKMLENWGDLNAGEIHKVELYKTHNSSCLVIQHYVIQNIEGVWSAMSKTVWKKVPSIKLRRKRVISV